MGRYGDGSPGGLPGFGIRTNFCIFHLRGKTPSTKHLWNSLANISDWSRIAALSALFGISSSPGVFLSPIPVHAAQYLLSYYLGYGMSGLRIATYKSVGLAPWEQCTNNLP